MPIASAIKNVLGLRGWFSRFVRGQNGAAQGVAFRRVAVRPPFARRALIEALEQRLLLSDTPLEPPPVGATITVNSAVDTDQRDAVITLREAIRISNLTLAVSSLTGAEQAQLAGTPELGTRDLIRFDIPEDQLQPIVVAEGGLPHIFEPVVIDGTTQPGFDASTHAPIIEIDASGGGSNRDNFSAAGLEILGGFTVIKGLNIHGAPGDGIRIRDRGGDVGGNIIIGNFIGTDLTGTRGDGFGNTDSGVLILDSPNNRIGGSAAGERNLISGNGTAGIVISGDRSTGNRVQGNWIGIDSSGGKGLGNGGEGVLITAPVGEVDYASSNLIGGSEPGEGNVISGNLEEGIAVVRGAENRILGNRIGTDKDGLVALGNRDGVILIGAPGTLVGGSGAHEQNLISGNTRHGIQIAGSSATDTVVKGNLIGTDRTGAAPLANAEDGIFIGEYINDLSKEPVAVEGAPSNTVIGGRDPAEGNVISGNGRDGVRIEAGATNTFVRGNLIGVTRLGLDVLGNAQNGVSIHDSPSNTIGGAVDEAAGILPGNIIGGNVRGIYMRGFEATGNVVQGNYVGLDAVGGAPMKNIVGIYLDIGAAFNTVGGSDPALRNVISGNNFGVVLDGRSNTLAGNFIGTNFDGTAAVANSEGVVVLGSGNTIGGMQLDAFELRGGNLISGNGEYGIRLASSSGDTTIKGNFIGTDVTGIEALPNEDGIIVDNSAGNTIGGETLAPGFSPGNLISGNRRHGIVVQGKDAENNRVQGNVIGLSNAGLLRSNGGDGIQVVEGHDNIIGGTTENERNVISGSGESGIRIERGFRNRVSGNFIGTDKIGSGNLLASGNILAGVAIVGGFDNVIGFGPDADVLHDTRNVISANLGYGIYISGESATGNLVTGNYVGTDATAAAAVPNQLDGVIMRSGASRNNIGFIGPLKGNVISGNEGHGIRIEGSSTTSNTVWNNLIGVGADRSTQLGNRGHGISIDARNTQVGGEIHTMGNTIAFNGAAMQKKGHGVAVVSGTGNRISGNSIFGNAGRGIDLGGDSFDINDIGEAFSGGAGNNKQDYPVVAGVQVIGGQKLIRWELDSTPTTEFRIEYFSNDQPDPSGFGEGKKFLGSISVTTDAEGFVGFSGLYDVSEKFISATATDPSGNTSEFSMVDSDGDALADAWEDSAIAGFIDIDEDGTPDLSLTDPKYTNWFGLAVSPIRKDLFVEVDAMTGLVPVSNILVAVESAFYNAPAALVNNPSGAQGIALHTILDEKDLPRFPFLATEAEPDVWPEFDVIKREYFGTQSERSNPAALAAKRLVFRYALFAQQHGFTTSGGIAELGTRLLPDGERLGLGGNDFMVTMGTWERAPGSVDGVGTSNDYGGSDEDQAATFMHELGHTLGLFHGGHQFGESFNYKPNYHSVMNYLWNLEDAWMREDVIEDGMQAFRDLNGNGVKDPLEPFLEIDRDGDGWSANDTSFVLNYSDQRFNDLDERSLVEAAGIGGHFVQGPTGLGGHWVIAGTVFGEGLGGRVVREFGPVDWNGDGDTDDVVTHIGDGANARPVDLNNLNRDQDNPSPGQILQGSEDWSRLRFYFREVRTFGDGNHGIVLPPDSTASGPSPEMTLETREALASLGEGPGFVQLSLTNRWDASEAGGLATFVVARVGGTDGMMTVDFATADGSAVSGEDYVATSGTLTFEEGQYLASFAISILDDTVFESGETFKVFLSRPTGGGLGQRIQADVSLGDDDGAGAFEFESAAYVKKETEATATVTVKRTGGANGAATVDVASLDGLAWAGADYVAVNRTLQFADGESSKTFNVTLLDDTIVEDIESLRLVLGNPSGGTAMGAIGETRIIIRDVEQGVVHFSDSVYERDENAGTATITLIRSNGSDGTLSVVFTTSNGTATGGTDFVTAAGTITFADGESAKKVSLQLLDDNLAERTETIILTLAPTAGGGSTGTPVAAELRILDDEPATFEFAAASFDAIEDTAVATIEVDRFGRLDDVASVDFATAGGTGIAHTDFIPTVGTLTFLSREAVLTFVVPVLDDALGEGTKTVALELRNPSAGARLGEAITAMLRILDDETLNATTFVVTNTNDSGAGSLRQAILNANARPGTDFITFNIPGDGVKTIRPLSALPVITSPVTIDGYMQPGASPNTLQDGNNAVLRIELDGSGPVSARGVLFLQASHNIVRGLVVNRFTGIGIGMDQGGGNLIAGNFVGTDATGMIGLGSGTGITIGSGENNPVFSKNNVIGGIAPELRNVVSSIAILSTPSADDLSKSRNNRILGNYVGVAADAMTALANAKGIRISTGDLGGPQELPGNVIGGIEAGAGNIIAFGPTGGVTVESGYGNSIRGNSIHSNDPTPPQNVGDFRGLGITLSELGGRLSSLNINDPADADTGDNFTSPGGNRLQNYPVLSSAIVEDGTITIQGRLDSAPRTTFQIDFYANEQMDLTGFGEGRHYLGTAAVTTGATGRGEFSADFDLSILNIRFITATATDPGNNTSQFSARVTVGEALGSVYVVNTTDDHDDGVADALHTSLREAIHAANSHPGKDLIRFDIPGSGVRTIRLDNALPPIVDPVTIDGYTQPGATPNSLEIGFNAQLLIQISRQTNSLPWGLAISGGNSTVRGLIINGFGSSTLRGDLVLVGTGQNVIEGNILGLDATGTSVTNSEGSILAKRSSHNLIGGRLPEARNLLVGVNLTSGSDNNRVQGNYVGVEASGVSRLPGPGAGLVRIDRSSSNFIGGSAPGEGNVLGGQLSIVGGIADLAGFSNAGGNQVRGNRIGVAGGVSLPGDGSVRLSGAANGNAIGGIAPGAGNVIAGGVRLDSFDLFYPTSNAIRGNSIHSSSLGINLEGDIFSALSIGVTPNDDTDIAVGPNRLQNFPVLSSALNIENGITIEGRLNSKTHSAFMIDFYANEEIGPGGHGGGQTFIGTVRVITDATGRAEFSTTMPVAIPNGRFITATATSTENNTSEFSARITVGDVIDESVFIVNTPHDHDDGIADAADTTLREAIHAANNRPGHDVILFDIPGEGVRTITLSDWLPTITDPVTIDGYSQPGASPNTLADGNDAILLIEITSHGAVVDIRAGNSTVRGLVINGALNDGIFIAENGGNSIEGNFIGTDHSGTIARGGGRLSIFSSSDNTIGGFTPGARNVIAGAVQISGGSGPADIPNEASFYQAFGNRIQGNYIGVEKNGLAALGTNTGLFVGGTFDNLIGGTGPEARNVIVGNVVLGANGFQDLPAGNVLQGNYIGTDRTGRVALAGGGIAIGGIGNIVGGTAAGAGNVISGSTGFGVSIGGDSHVVQGNRIGTNVDGTLPLGNRGGGIRITGSANLIGGSEPGGGNLISGNGGDGIQLTGFIPSAQTNQPATGNVIQGNLIGTQADGVSALPNIGDGILVTPSLLFGTVPLQGAVDNVIGGTAVGAGNIIAFNGGNGINLAGGATGTAGTEIAILGNAIFSNRKLGIDLKGNGPSANDAGDLDSGDNGLQNFPVLTSVTNTGSSVTIQGTLASLANATYRIEFFASRAFDPSGFGEGARLIGAATVTTNASGSASFAATFDVAMPLTHIVTATATDAQGNSSEFSGRQPNGSFGETANLVVTHSAPDSIPVGQLLLYTLTVTNNGPDAATNVVLHDTLPSGVALQPSSQGVLLLGDGRTIVASLGTIESGASASVRIEVTPLSEATLVNSASVFSDQYDPDASNNTSTASTTVRPTADLSVAVSSNLASVGVGELVRFDITVAYVGSETARQVTLTDTLPAALSFDSFNGPGGFVTGNTIVWSLGNYSSGDSETLSFFARANTLGTVTNNATVTSNTAEVNTTNNSVSTEIVIAPSADVRLTAAAPVLAIAGDVARYTLTIVNDGPAAADGIVLTNTLPSNAGFIAATTTQGDVDVGNGIVTFAIGALASGASATAEISVAVPSAGEHLTNVAVLTTASHDPAQSNNSVSSVTRVLDGGTAPLFGAAHSSRGSASLYAIDPLTGSASLIGPIGFDRVSAMDFNPRTGVLYAIGQRPGTSTRILMTIDPSTGIGTEVGPTNSIRRFTDVSFRDDGALFAYVAELELLTLDLATGQASLVGSATVAGGNGNGLEFAPDGTLYHADDQTLSSLDPTSGSATAVTDLSFSSPADDFPRLNAMDFDRRTGLMFGSLNDGEGSDNENFLSLIDLSTGNVSIIGRTIDGLDAIAFAVLPQMENRPPVLAPIGDQRLAEGASRTISVTAFDADTDAITLSATGLPSFASFTDNGDGTAALTLAPAFDGAGFYAITIRASDGTDEDQETFAIVVDNTNRAPVAVDDEYSTNEDEHLIVSAGEGLLIADADLDGDSFTVVFFAQPSHGSVEVGPDGSFTYTPTADFHGEDTFTYRVNDGTADSNAATVAINVLRVNDAPIAFDDAIGTDEDTAASFDPRANDADVDGDELRVEVVAQPQHGVVTVNPDGTASYVPHENFHGVDRFSYVVSDDQASSVPAEVEIRVVSVNDAPFAEDVEAATDEDAAVTIDVSAAVSDVDNSAAEIAVEILTGPAHGTVSANAGGTFTYTPDANFFGVDSFTYRASDGALTSDPARADISIDPVNDAPVTGDDSFNAFESQTLDIDAAGGLLANDNDPDRDALAVSFFTDPANGTIQVSDDGSFTYTPQLGFQGIDRFSYRISDGLGGEATGQVTIEVLPAGSLKVLAFDADCNHFAVRFNDSYDADQINLYMSASDVIVRGSTTGLIAGSLIHDPDGKGFVFVKNGAAFAADTYSVTLKSGPSAFTSARRGALDGDADGNAGGDYVTTFSVVSPSAVKIGLPDFMRGPGQDVHVPAALFQGLPLKLTSAGDVTSLALEINYNPANLQITGASAASALPAGSSFEFDASDPGIARIQIEAPTPFAAGTLTILNLEAHVPLVATYKARHYIDVRAVEINGQLVGCADDDAFHLVGYLGDANASETYELEDVEQILKIAVRATNGFAAWDDVNPLMVADIDENRFITSTDAARVNQEMSGIDRLEIPPLPARSLVEEARASRLVLDPQRFSAALTGENEPATVKSLAAPTVDLGRDRSISGSLPSGTAGASWQRAFVTDSIAARNPNSTIKVTVPAVSSAATLPAGSPIATL